MAYQKNTQSTESSSDNTKLMDPLAYAASQLGLDREKTLDLAISLRTTGDELNQFVEATADLEPHERCTALSELVVDAGRELPTVIALLKEGGGGEAARTALYVAEALSQSKGVYGFALVEEAEAKFEKNEAGLKARLATLDSLSTRLEGVRDVDAAITCDDLRLLLKGVASKVGRSVVASLTKIIGSFQASQELQVDSPLNGGQKQTIVAKILEEVSIQKSSAEKHFELAFVERGNASYRGNKLEIATLVDFIEQFGLGEDELKSGGLLNKVREAFSPGLAEDLVGRAVRLEDGTKVHVSAQSFNMDACLREATRKGKAMNCNDIHEVLKRVKFQMPDRDFVSHDERQNWNGKSGW